jgi:uncharacterized protein YlxW (UPF0749 family)
MITCCEIALVLGITNVISLALFASYTVKLKDKQISLEKEVKEVESVVNTSQRINGKEKTDIKELQELSYSLKREIKQLQNKLEKYEQNK